MEKLDNQGRLHEIVDRHERFREIANEYGKHPEGTLVVSPDNQSRMEINQVIHTEMQARGQVDHREERLNVLVARQEITGVDRQWAEQYQPGDIVRYTKGSKTHGIKAGEYARVEKIDAKENLVSVKKRTGKQVTYDPRRLQGVTLYREADRAFSRGDRVQFTAPDREQHIANRELASVEKIDRKGNIRLRLDSGRSVAFNIKENPHLDYGYAVTSHSSQGQTADRVLVHVDTEQASEKLVNRRLAYVAVSRGRYDAQIYTNDKTQLAEGLGRDVSRRTATQPHRESAGPAKRESPELELERERDRTQTQSYDIGR
jgi:ATP-dependent exoDNAse (exonuclease V) alpha subunit